MYQSAEDDAERRRIEAKLYAPPTAQRRPRGSRPAAQQPQRGALTLTDAKSLMAQLSAQDAQLGSG
ncbi:hypothetical protein ACFYSF_22245 [Streptomyces canus]|uniref:hypothetical protein n=1 Tax=Streptomyces canus TaxID=58343 RepID=UPI0036A99543